MLKPWVVQVLAWAYRVGVAVMVSGVVLLWRQQRDRMWPWGRRLAAAGVSAAGWGCAFAAAGALEYDPPNLMLLMICVAVFGYLRWVDPRRIHLLRLVPLGVGVMVVGLVLETGLDAASRQLLPAYEKQLGEGVSCRAYPVPDDSLEHPRLLLIREQAGWRDEVLDELEGDFAARFPGCEHLPDGAVRLYIRDVDGREVVQKRVVVRQ